MKKKTSVQRPLSLKPLAANTNGDGVALTSMEHPDGFFDEGGPAEKMIEMFERGQKPDALDR